MNQIVRTVASRVALFAGLALVGAAAASRWHAVADDATSSGTKPERTRAALHAAVEKNLGYCRDWLGAKDWKSLRQSADGVGILAAVLARQSDDEKWRGIAGRLVPGVQALCAAADGKETEKCGELIEQLSASNKELTKLTKVKPRTEKTEKVGEKPIESLRSVMLLLDGSYADAKAAVAVSDMAEAKSMAVVLSELGRVVSNHRADAAWRSAAEAMIRAATEAADDKTTDDKTVRQQLRGVYQKCQACHERQRQ